MTIQPKIYSINKVTSVTNGEDVASNDPSVALLAQKIDQLSRKIDSLERRINLTNDEALWSIEDIATYLRVSTSSVRKYLAAPSFPPAYKPQVDDAGRCLHRRYLAKDIKRWATRHPELRAV